MRSSSTKEKLLAGRSLHLASPRYRPPTLSPENSNVSIQRTIHFGISENAAAGCNKLQIQAAIRVQIRRRKRLIF
jgi:hypothetical protein